MWNKNWEGPYIGEPNKKIYTRRITGFDYDPRLNIGIATLNSFGVKLADAQKDPYGIQRNLLAFSGLEPFQLMEEFVVAQVAQLPPSLQNTGRLFNRQLNLRRN